MRKLNENERKVKYLGEGLVGVYQGEKLVERYELEKGDDLLEGMKKMTEASKEKVFSHGSGYDPMYSGDIGSGKYEITVSTDSRWIDSLGYERQYLNIRVYDNDKRKFVISALVRFSSPSDRTYATGLANELTKSGNFNQMVDILESDPKVEELEVNRRMIKEIEG